MAELEEASILAGQPAGVELTEDAFLGEALRVLQPRRGYRAGLDAVLLAAAAPLERGDGAKKAGDVRVLDVGAGVGVVGLCLAHRVATAQVTLVERDPFLASVARENIVRNRLGDRVQVAEADVAQPLGSVPELQAMAETFDVVLSNPPYHDSAAGTSSADALKAASHAMPAGSLDRWVQFMASMARPGGAMAIIHRSDALTELLGACARRFGALVVSPIYPRAGAAANRIIISGIKGSRAPLAIAAGCVLHGSDGRFLPEIDAVLRHGASLRG